MSSPSPSVGKPINCENFPDLNFVFLFAFSGFGGHSFMKSKSKNERRKKEETNIPTFEIEKK